MADSFWQSLARSLGLAPKATRETTIQKYLADLKSSNPDVRRSAAWSLGKMKPPPKEAVQALTDATQDPSEFVRRSANWALKIIRGG